MNQLSFLPDLVDVWPVFAPQVARNAGSVCGPSANSACTPDDISDVDFDSRRADSISVSFSLNVLSSDAASSAVSTFTAYINSGNFAVDLSASGAPGVQLKSRMH